MRWQVRVGRGRECLWPQPLVAPLVPFFYPRHRSRSLFWVPSGIRRSGLTAVAKPGARFLFPSLARTDCLCEGRSGRCSSVRAHRAKEAALSPPGWPALNSRPAPVKTGAPAGHRSSRETLLAFWKPLLPPRSRRRPEVRSHGPLLSRSSNLVEDLGRAGTPQS